PQVAGVLGDEAAPLGRRAPYRARGDARELEEPVHARARERAQRDLLRALQHADDPPDRAARLLPLRAEDELGDLRRDRAALATVRARGRAQRVEAALLVGVVPALDGARRDLDQLALRWHLVHARGDLLEELDPVPGLEPRAHERAEHTDAPQ